jgi:hypothetical protein
MVNTVANHEQLVEKSEHALSSMATQSSSSKLHHHVSNDADPINIICMDGGGMNGYSHAVALIEMNRDAKGDGG